MKMKYRAMIAAMFFVAWGMLLAPPCRAREGRVLTAHGVSREGQVVFAGTNDLTVDGTRLDWDAVFCVELTPLTRPPESVAPVAVEPIPSNGTLPQGWQARDIGQTRQPGTVTYRVERRGSPEEHGLFTLKSQGLGLHGRQDSCQFLSRPLQGDGVLFARVVSLQWTERAGLGGIMLRSGNSPDAVRISLAISVGEGAVLHWREQAGAEARSLQQRDVKTPHWVKLERQGNRVTGFRSKDGVQWDFVETVKINLPETVEAGIFTTSARDHLSTSTKISHVQLCAGLPPPPPTQFTLGDGSTFEGQIQSGGHGSLTVLHHEQSLHLAVTQLVRVQFGPLPPDWADKIPPGKPGILTRKGDFMEGSLRDLDRENIRIKLREKSVESTFLIGWEVLALQLGQEQAHASLLEVRGQNGLLWYAQSLRMDKGRCLIQHDLAGLLDYPEMVVTRIKRLATAGPYASRGTQTDQESLRSDLVTTTDGRTLSGSIQCEAETVLISPPSQPPVPLALAQIARLVRGAPRDSQAGDNRKLSAEWKGADLGHVQAKGSFQALPTPGFGPAENLTILGGGEAIQKQQDAFYFVQKTLEGNGEITACITSLEHPLNTARAGLMFREKSDPGAKTFFLGLTAADGLIFQLRKNAGSYMDSTHIKEAPETRTALAAPIWLKLERDGKTLNALYSLDGKKWTMAGTDTVEMSDKAMVGMAVVSRRLPMLGRGVFDSVTVRSTAPQSFSPRVVLTHGTQFAYREITATDDSQIKFITLGGREIQVPTSKVAALLFQPVEPAAMANLGAGRSGVLLRSGDFIDGEFRALDRDQIRLGSVLLGTRTYKIREQASALIFRDPETAEFPVTATLFDGSRIQAASLALKQGRWEFQEPLLGLLTFAATELAEFTRQPKP